MSGKDERPVKRRTRKATFQDNQDLRPDRCAFCYVSGEGLEDYKIVININDRSTTFNYVCSTCGVVNSVKTVGGIVVR